MCESLVNAFALESKLKIIVLKGVNSSLVTQNHWGSRLILSFLFPFGQDRKVIVKTMKTYVEKIATVSFRLPFIS